MSFSTLIEIVNRVADEIGLSRKTAVVSSTDNETRQLLAHANATGRDLMRAHDWGALQSLGTITTANGTSDYSLASDYDRMIADTAWDRTTTWQVAGPDSVQLNRALREGILTGGSQKRFRLTGTTLNITPTPTAIETIVYEYVSKKWAQSYDDEFNPTVATPQLEFLDDSYTTVFDPDLVKAEIKWRFMAGKGMYADALKDEAMSMRALKIAGDIGGTTLQMQPASPREFISLDNVPDGSWA
jgi:hypothetical protein